MRWPAFLRRSCLTVLFAAAAQGVRAGVQPSFEVVGQYGAEVAAYPDQNFLGDQTSGVITLNSIPPGATIVRATLYGHSWFDGKPPAAMNATFAGVTLGWVTHFDADSHLRAYRWDVTSLVTGNGPYQASARGFIATCGMALAVVYQHASLPMTQVIVADGATTVADAGPEVVSTVFPALQPGSYDLLIYTQGDDAFFDVDSDEGIYFNGVCVGGPIDENLGPTASVFRLPVDAPGGDSQCMLYSPVDLLGWQLAVVTAHVPGPQYLKVPLGKTVVQVAGDPGFFKVYVPDRWGGKLKISASAGTVEAIRYPGKQGNPDPSAPAYQNDTETGEKKHGWYTFQVKGNQANNYNVTTTFTQTGEAKATPWNFFYFPFLHDERPNLFDDVKINNKPYGALKKYDTNFKLNGQALKAEHTIGHALTAEMGKKHEGGVGWWGHCDGATIASILIKQPKAKNPFAQDELEGLASEFFTSAGRFLTMLAAVDDSMDGQKPSATEARKFDKRVNLFHDKMCEMLRKERKAFLIDVKQADGVGPIETKDEKPNKRRTVEVWNHACFRYAAVLQEDPDAQGNEETEKIFQIKVSNTFATNEDFVDPSKKDGVSEGNPKDGNYRREQLAEYLLIYGQDGSVTDNGKVAQRQQKWLSVKLKHSLDKDVQGDKLLFVPKWMFDPTPLKKYFANDRKLAGINPWINAANLMQLGLEKNELYQK